MVERFDQVKGETNRITVSFFTNKKGQYDDIRMLSEKIIKLVKKAGYEVPKDCMCVISFFHDS